ncbi:uncharacterized protein PAC_07702 [Phialocephala subalpina]|uniref:Major facilitator superfamily (MFS) profile domain-containing protein n=1 Tax=Phialocephala subalpina TaxID=576137 RepID=A0A1L7WYH4_9HELO|nr:uncharacterized protein PAC_07702 [Phialocephala subalpina]
MAKSFTRLAEVIRWYPKGMPSAERHLVHKIDLLVLSYACLSFFTKYLDVSALTNAYVSGMKEDLNLYGNRLNYITAVYEVGYVVFQIPSNLVLQKIPAQYWLPAAEIFWGLFTLGTVFVQSYNQLVVMRFFVGLSATSCYVGLVHIVNTISASRCLRKPQQSWRSPRVEACFSPAPAMLNSDILLGGSSSFAPSSQYPLLFCKSPPLSLCPQLNDISGFFFFPDIPGRTNSRWLTEEEKTLAVTRLEKDGFKSSTGLNKTLWKRVLLTWEFYAFVSLLVLFCITLYPSGTPFILWLKSQPDKYSIPLVNNIGTVTNAAAVVSALVTSYYTDLRGKRWEPILFSGVLAFFSNLVLAIWTIPPGMKFFAYIAIGWVNGTIPIIGAWTAEGLAGDPEARSVTLATYNCVAEIMGLVVPLVAWPVSKAPRFRGGFIWVTATIHFDNATYQLRQWSGQNVWY